MTQKRVLTQPATDQTTVDSPVGEITLLASPTGLREVVWPTSQAVNTVGEHSNPNSIKILDQARSELTEYFAGDRSTFDLPLDPVGTEFQLSVWRVLQTIPYGQTISYGEQAKRLGDQKKARAVGGANGRNPLSIVVPCHRVIGANGSLTGFGGGLDTKSWLLKHEQDFTQNGDR